MVKLGSIIIQVRGVSYSPNDLHDSLNDESVILLRANNIQDGKINFDDVIYIDKKKVKKNRGCSQANDFATFMCYKIT